MSGCSMLVSFGLFAVTRPYSFTSSLGQHLGYTIVSPIVTGTEQLG